MGEPKREPKRGGRSRSASKPPASPRAASSGAAVTPLPFFLDADRVHFLLYVPNLIGYARVLALALAMAAADPYSIAAVRLLFVSMALDYFDGPAARALRMCTVFGDLLDHVTDHVTMMWLVYITQPATLFGSVNIAINVLCNIVIALGFMLVKGHYFKHAAAANWVTRATEANNYWNPLSVLWCANTIIIPLIKLSYSASLGLAPTASTELLDLLDAMGLVVTLVYSLACVHAAGIS